LYILEENILIEENCVIGHKGAIPFGFRHDATVNEVGLVEGQFTLLKFVAIITSTQLLCVTV